MCTYFCITILLICASRIQTKDVMTLIEETIEKAEGNATEETISGNKEEEEKVKIWEPKTTSRADFLRCHGLPCDEWERIMDKLNTVQRTESDAPFFDGLPEQVTEGCFWYSEEQVDHILQRIQNHGGQAPAMLDFPPVIVSTTTPEPSIPVHWPRMPADWPLHKKKEHMLKLLMQIGKDEGIEETAESLELYRTLAHYIAEKIDETDHVGPLVQHDTAQSIEADADGKMLRNFNDMPTYLWPIPIVYMYDGTHSVIDQAIIRRAFSHWEEHTCVRFVEFSKNSPVSQPHLVITSQSLGCYSFVGRTGKIPQVINLAPQCLQQLGTPVHEIGHALGLFHEQQRADRDDWIDVKSDNILYYRSQFYKQPTVSYDVPYDYGSVMHYVWNAGSFNQAPTMIAKDPKYKLSMGQRVGLSFLDAKIINRAYCNKQDECPLRPLVMPCRRGGYQDPNHCGRCLCPDGFGGQFCQEVAPSTQEQCGGVVEVTRTPVYIETPGYQSMGHYDDNTECAWIVKAPAGEAVRLDFEGSFGVFCKGKETCFHWVEVKYTDKWDYPGPRYCCYKTPTDPIISTTNEMVIVFKSSYETVWATERRGFRAKLSSTHMFAADNTILPLPNGNSPPSPTPAPTYPPASSWSAWGRCQQFIEDVHDLTQCKCGGCSHQKRYRMCINGMCEGRGSAAEVRPCDQVCGSTDRYLSFNDFIEKPCPQCCPDFNQQNDKCVLNY